MLAFEDYIHPNFNNKNFEIPKVRIPHLDYEIQGKSLRYFKFKFVKQTNVQVNGVNFHIEAFLDEKQLNLVMLKINSESLTIRKGITVYKIDGCFIILDDIEKSLSIFTKPNIADGYFLISPDSQGKFIYNPETRNFFYGTDTDLINNPSLLFFEFIESTELINNSSRGSLSIVSNPSQKNVSFNNIKRDLVVTKSQNSKRSNFNVSLNQEQEDRKFIESEIQKESIRDSAKASSFKRSKFLLIKDSNGNLIEKKELTPNSDCLETIFKEMLISIQPDTYFEADFVLKCPNSFTFDSSIFKPYFDEERKKEQDYSFPPNCIFVGEVKTFYDFPQAYLQLRQKLLFLKKILNEKKPVVGFLIFKASSEEYLTVQRSKIQELKQEFLCEIFVLFTQNDFLFINTENVSEDNHASALLILFAEIENIPENRLPKLSLFITYIKKLNPFN